MRTLPRLAGIPLLAVPLALGCDASLGDSGASRPDSGVVNPPNPAPTSDAAPWIDAAPTDDATPPIEVDCEAIWQRPGHGTTFYEDNPTYVDPQDDTASWVFSSPEDQGMDATLLADAAAYLELRSYVWSLLVIRNDAMVLEQYFHGSDARDSNNTHSASKSILSALVGIAIEQGFVASLDQPIAEILPGHFEDISDPDKRDITVRHLLTMTAGFAWYEDDTEYEIEDDPDWVQAILELWLRDTPGEDFNYSTGQAHVMSAVLTEATGMSLCELAHRHLLGHLGITAEHWGRDPQGYFSGGYNLYLTPRELAKFGLLYLHGGNWRGTQVVPQVWVDESVERHMPAGGGYGYGYYWWLKVMGGHDVYVAWGWGGQFVYVIPDLDVVTVITTNTRDYSVDFDGEFLLESYVIPAVD